MAKVLAIAGGLVLAATVGYAINSGELEPASTATVTPRSWSPQVQSAFGASAPASGAIASAVDPFIEANTTALDRLVPSVGPSSTRGDAFISANTTGLEYPATPYTERWNGPR